MNENLDLVEKLKNCPKGTNLWSPLFGEVIFNEIVPSSLYPIRMSAKTDFGLKNVSFTKCGKHYCSYSDGECMLFPNKNQRDWDKFIPIEKFDYSTLKPFDKILVRFEGGRWKCSWFSYMMEDMIYDNGGWPQGIPYNKDTEHLVGTTEDPDEKYVWWSRKSK